MLAIVGGLFVLETVSVIVQVASFKLTGKRVFNVSTPTDLAGYGALIAYARKLGSKFGTVVLAICMENDLLDYGAGAGDADRVLVANPEGVRGWLERTSAAYLLLTTAVQQTAWLKAPAVWLGVITPNLEGIAQSDFSEAAIDSSARKVADLARNQRLLVVIIPSRALWIGDNRAVEDRIHKGFLAALGRLGIDFVDLRPLLEAGGQPLSYHFANDGHWNARGHRLAGSSLRQALAQRAVQAGLPTHVHPHMLRHSFASHLLQEELSTPRIVETSRFREIDGVVLFVDIVDSTLRTDAIADTGPEGAERRTARRDSETLKSHRRIFVAAGLAKPAFIASTSGC